MAVEFQLIIYSKGQEVGQGKYPVVRLIEGREEMSALYEYDILVKTTEEAESVQKMLGNRVRLTVTSGDMKRTVHGIVMSIESTRQYAVETEQSDSGSDLAWYKWTIRPAFAQACYSQNRLVYRKCETLGDGSTLLVNLVSRWGGGIEISEAAKKRMPDFIQLIQNDESDYNFFARVLAMWGLGYYWTRNDKNTSEVLCVVDVVGVDDSLPSIENEMLPVSQKASYWKINYGFQCIDKDKMANCIYNQHAGKDQAIVLNLHEECIDSLSEAAVLLGKKVKEAPEGLDALKAIVAEWVKALALELAEADKEEVKEMVVNVLKECTWYVMKVGTWQYDFDGAWTEYLKEKPETKIKDQKEKIKKSFLTEKVAELRSKVATGAGTYIGKCKKNNGSPDVFLATHDNQGICHGMCCEAFQGAQIGQKLKWRALSENKADRQCDAKAMYYLTKLTITASRQGVSVKVEGRSARSKAKEEASKGIGVVPCPVCVNDQPDLHNEVLIRKDACPKPKMRTFMAIVEDESMYQCGTGHNLCRVREIAAWKMGKQEIGEQEIAEQSLENALWVEMGSPFADADSGLLARPRKGNVLLCLDRGDLSIPIVLTSLFRDGNNPPVASLSGTRDTTAITLRNRSIKYGTSSAVADMTPYSVPRSVHSLCTDKPLCSQIQLIGKDNVSTPNSITTSLSQDIVKAAHPEFGLGIAMGTNTVHGMFNLQKTHKTADAQMQLKERSHFQGINMYSEKDVLLQSSDSQFVNAGGTINITAAAGITLRVGRNSIVISEKGIELVNGCGHVDHPGASAAFPGDSKEKIDFAGGASHNAAWNNAIVLDQSGIGIQGTCIKNSAINNVRMEVSQGGLVELNNYEATITAPHTKIIGGAALLNTLTYGLAGVCNAGMKGDSKAGEGAMGLDYVGMAAGGLSTIISEAVNGGVKGLGSGLFHSILSKYLNCISVTGSMVDLAPYEMTLSSQKTYNESFEHHLYTFAASGLRALGESSIGGFLTCGITDATSITNDQWYFFGDRIHRAINGKDADFQTQGVSLQNHDVKVKNTDAVIRNEITTLRTDVNNVTASANQINGAVTACNQRIETISNTLTSVDNKATRAFEAVNRALSNNGGIVVNNP